MPHELLHKIHTRGVSPCPYMLSVLMWVGVLMTFFCKCQLYNPSIHKIPSWLLPIQKAKDTTSGIMTYAGFPIMCDGNKAPTPFLGYTALSWFLGLYIHKFSLGYILLPKRLLACDAHMGYCNTTQATKANAQTKSTLV